MKSILRLFYVLAFSILSVSGADTQRPVILLTGYWKPTNEMLRPFSKNPAQNPGGYIGENWRGLGYDVVAYFPEFPAGREWQGVGDFEVDPKDTLVDFNRVTALHNPIAIISFGRGDGPWEIETNAPDYYGQGPKLKNSLPAEEIKKAVNKSGSKLKAWIDTKDDAGDYVCGYLSHLGALYHETHIQAADPARNIAQGFIHVKAGKKPEDYRLALEATLTATATYIDLQIRAEAARKSKPQTPAIASVTL